MTTVGAKLNEPSMEEILASIRRIIADDQETLQIVQGPGEPKEGSPLRNVLDLTERHVAADIRSAPLDMDSEATIALSLEDEGEFPEETEAADFSATAKAEQAEPPRPAAPPTRAPAMPVIEPAMEETLLSDAANASVLGSFERLGASMVQSSPKTLEDLAKEMLRPMLKTWLDDNLPLLVERLVQAEIERIARSRR